MPSDQPHAASKGRRERNKQRVRNQIYSSAVALFAEKGYEGTTIDDITERADVARGTFFNYFQRKDDLITEWAELRRRAVSKRLELPLSIGSTDVASVLHLCFATLAQVNEEERELSETMLSAWVKAGKPLTEAPHTAEVFARILRMGQERNQIDADVDATLVGDMLRDVYLGALYRWARHRSEPGELGDSLGTIVDIFLHGIVVRPADSANTAVL
ncbi:TetR/AcrR family transcriptional regulator [Nocardia rhizosphaerae]|uniref:TetR/AcrR family transcriptional regulator n=1 Tax=Nocardia rhizosphaerae TaxID=1691571 RepID=A0ABV8L890_9NOCA